MPLTGDRPPLTVDISGKNCEVPDDQRTRVQPLLEQVRQALPERAAARLSLHAVRYPRSGDYHVEARLKLPRHSLFAGARSAYLDAALQASLHDLIEEVRADRPRSGDGAPDRDPLLPPGADAGPVADAFRAGEYAHFRTALLTYEDWLRKRIGRWVQRYPEAEARLGGDLLIGDLLEEVYLVAFETFDRHPRDVPLHTWLEGLIDPALHHALRHPDAVRQEASLARSLRDVGR